MPASRCLDENRDVTESQEQDEYLDTNIGIPLRSINVVTRHVPFIEDARTKVTTEMESMVLNGLTTLVRLPFLSAKVWCSCELLIVPHASVLEKDKLDTVMLNRTNPS